MASAPQSDARIEFRLPSALKEEIEQAATVQNRSLTDFATAVLSEMARKVLGEHKKYEHIQMTNRDRDRFLAMLDEGAAPNAALRAAATRHRKRVT